MNQYSEEQALQAYQHFLKNVPEVYSQEAPDFSYNSPGVVRFGSDGEWYLMNKKENGWSSWGMRFGSLPELVTSAKVRLGSFGHDKHGPYVEVFTDGPFVKMRKQ